MVEQHYYKSLKCLIKDEKQQINPKLVLSYKEWDERVNAECPKWGYEANFVSISKWSYKDKEWKVIPGFEIIMDDEQDWEVRFTSAWTNPARFFINSLCGWTWQTIGRMKISVSADDKFSGKMRANLWLSVDWQPGSQMLKWEEKNKYVVPIPDPENPEEIVWYKYGKLEAFFETQYDRLNKMANTIVNQVEREVEHKTEEPMDLKSKETPVDVLDLPF